MELERVCGMSAAGKLKDQKSKNNFVIPLLDRRQRNHAAKVLALEDGDLVPGQRYNTPVINCTIDGMSRIYLSLYFSAQQVVGMVRKLVMFSAW